MAITIIIDKDIPFIKGLLDDVAEVRYLEAKEITPAAMHGADALITRTRTRCNKILLDGSRCSFIGTATIGTDHIDLDYCRKRHIAVANAPGCNASAVAQYVFASIAQVIDRQLSDYTLGIVGVGHVGSIVERWARQMDMHVLLCDPPRAAKEGGNGFVGLSQIAEEADIITFHTPLTYDGRYRTFHLCDTAFLSATKRYPLIINSARGAVVDTEAMVKALESGQIANAIIDCWENEPEIDRCLLERAAIATPHIAGYSREGKIRAVAMVLKALTAHFGLPEVTVKEPLSASAATNISLEAIMESYDPRNDSYQLKTMPQLFEALRNNYVLRHEV